jgi:hypothetical protein
MNTENIKADHLDSTLNDAIQRKDYDTALEIASMSKNFEFAKELLISDVFKPNADIHAKDDSVLYWACNYGDLKFVKYLLTSPELKEHADIDTGGFGYALQHACAAGHLNIVKYLLTSPELKRHAKLNIGEIPPFYYACSSGQLEVVKYLLTSPDIKEHASPHYKESGFDESSFNRWSSTKKGYSPLISAALGSSVGQIQIIDYLLDTTELKVDIHEQEDIFFKNLCIYGKYFLIEHLVFRDKLKYTENIRNHLQQNPDKNIDSIFNAYFLDKELACKVKLDNLDNKKAKV